MSSGVCEHCGNRLAVAPVTYAYGDQRITQQLCARCKDTMLGRRRTRREPAQRRHRHRRRGRLAQALREGGPLAYVGVGLFVLGLVLLPTLITISLLTR